MDFSLFLKVCFYSLSTLEVNSRQGKQASFQKDLLLQKDVLPDELLRQLFCPSLGMYLLAPHRSGHRMPLHCWHTTFKTREKARLLLQPWNWQHISFSAERILPLTTTTNLHYLSYTFFLLTLLFLIPRTPMQLIAIFCLSTPPPPPPPHPPPPTPHNVLLSCFTPSDSCPSRIWNCFSFLVPGAAPGLSLLGHFKTAPLPPVAWWTGGLFIAYILLLSCVGTSYFNFLWTFKHQCQFFSAHITNLVSDISYQLCT